MYKADILGKVEATVGTDLERPGLLWYMGGEWGSDFLSALLFPFLFGHHVP